MGDLLIPQQLLDQQSALDAQAQTLRAAQAQQVSSVLSGANTQPDFGTQMAQSIGAGLPALLTGLLGGGTNNALLMAGAGGSTLDTLRKEEEARRDKQLQLGLAQLKFSPFGDQLKEIEKQRGNIQKAQTDLAIAGPKAKATSDAQHANKMAERAAGKSTQSVTVGAPIASEVLKEVGETAGNLALVDSALKEAENFKDDSLLEFRAKGRFTGTPQGKYFKTLDRLAAQLLKSDQGSRPSEFDLKLYQDMIKGDFTSNGKDMKQLLQRTRDMIIIKQHAKLSFLRDAGGAEKGPGAYQAMLDNLDKGAAPIATQVTPKITWEDYKAKFPNATEEHRKKLELGGFLQ